MGCSVSRGLHDVCGRVIGGHIWSFRGSRCIAFGALGHTRIQVRYHSHLISQERASCLWLPRVVVFA